MDSIVYTIPVYPRSSLNARLHWRARAARTKRERQAARLRTVSALMPSEPRGALLVTIERHSSGTLDGDNLQSCLKAVRDGIADALGIDDGSALIDWQYRQAKCKRGHEHVRVEIRGK